ncbi:short-chain dehydrogenase [Bacterioplanes sanyensis]|uniref:Short-chain dehydrogenase n=1 Tax=Bacterioplanes sanyensis TaxID=1249553 RepID=A0A222FFR9_9GAMM|nr:SDR family NAD(P)-dependent oxidoreductase [Bacterioplanes sanyensis]ASP37426.1 short-chain dehydrogenase [Bacterioplanes sanyensis]
MKSLRNKVAAVTGAGSGIGRALALQLANEGCHLALADIDNQGLDDTCELLAHQPVTVTRQTLNVADEAAVFAWAEQVVVDHGQVNLIINNAGVALSGTVDGLSLDDYRWIMDVNFWGVMYGSKAFLPKLQASGDGHIVNISSVFGLASQPLMSGYNASKFAVRGFTESLRQDLELTGSCVSATSVHPGGIKTNIAKAARMDHSCERATGVSNAAATADFERMFINTPEKAARTIIAGIVKNKRRVLIGPDARVFDWLVRLLPSAYQRLFTAAVRHQSRAQTNRATQA